MKVLARFIALNFLLPSALGASPQFVRVEPNQASYQVGEKAVVNLYVDRAPLDPKKEIFIEARVSGEKVDILEVSSNVFEARPGRFMEAGNVDFETNVFFQDIAEQRQLRQSEGFYKRKIQILENQLAGERDPEARKVIEAEIEQETFKLAAIQRRIEEQRTLVEVVHYQIQVLGAPLSMNVLSYPKPLFLVGSND